MTENTEPGTEAEPTEGQTAEPTGSIDQAGTVTSGVPRGTPAPAEDDAPAPVATPTKYDTAQGQPETD